MERKTAKTQSRLRVWTNKSGSYLGAEVGGKLKQAGVPSQLSNLPEVTVEGSFANSARRIGSTNTLRSKKQRIQQSMKYKVNSFDIKTL